LQISKKKNRFNFIQSRKLRVLKKTILLKELAKKRKYNDKSGIKSEKTLLTCFLSMIKNN